MKLKKGKYKFIKVVKIKSDELYSIHKSSLDKFVKKYHRHEGDPLLFYNTPIYLFAKDYIDNKQGFAERARKSPFVQCSMERYNVYTKKYEKELVSRMMNIVRSIRKYRYSRGKFRNKLICVVIKKGGGYELISGKHRAAACLALGMEIIKCNLYKQIRRK